MSVVRFYLVQHLFYLQVTAVQIVPSTLASHRSLFDAHFCNDIYQVNRLSCTLISERFEVTARNEMLVFVGRHAS